MVDLIFAIYTGSKTASVPAFSFSDSVVQPGAVADSVTHTFHPILFEETFPPQRLSFEDKGQINSWKQAMASNINNPQVSTGEGSLLGYLLISYQGG
jgi:hypothetical protein